MLRVPRRRAETAQTMHPGAEVATPLVVNRSRRDCAGCRAGIETLVSDFLAATGTVVTFSALLSGLATFGPWVVGIVCALFLLVMLGSRTIDLVARAIDTVVVPLVALFGNKTRSGNARAVLESRSGAVEPRRKGPS